MIQISPLQLVIVCSVCVGLMLACVLLGFFLGSLASKAYNTSAKAAMNNMGELNNHLASQVEFLQTVSSDNSVPRISHGSPEIVTTPRDDAYEALIEETQQGALDGMFRDMDLRDQAQVLAQAENPNADEKAT